MKRKTKLMRHELFSDFKSSDYSRRVHDSTLLREKMREKQRDVERVSPWKLLLLLSLSPSLTTIKPFSDQTKWIIEWDRQHFWHILPQNLPSVLRMQKFLVIERRWHAIMLLINNLVAFFRFAFLWHNGAGIQFIYNNDNDEFFRAQLFAFYGIVLLFSSFWEFNSD